MVWLIVATHHSNPLPTTIIPHPTIPLHQPTPAGRWWGGPCVPATGPCFHDHLERPVKLLAGSHSSNLYHPSSQFVPDPTTSPSDTGSASARRKPRSLNIGTVSTIRGSRSVDHGPRTMVQGSGFRVQGSGKVAGEVLTADLWERFTNLLI